MDVEGFDVEHNPTVVISCKCYKEVLPRYLPTWVEEFTRHLDGHWHGKQVKHFVLAVTHDGNDDDLNDVWRDQVAALKERGISGHLWNSTKITDLLRRDAGLVKRYFNPVWADAITASSSDSTPPVMQQKAGNSGVAYYQQLSAFAAQIDGAIKVKLETAISESRAGRPEALSKCLDEAIDDPSAWEVLNPETKARLLRTRAVAKLQSEDTISSRDLLSEADSFAPPPDNVARALIAAVESGIESGLGLLDPPRSVREREVAAGWQIQLNDLAGAISTLAVVQGDDVTTEVLRLRAIAEFVLGHRSVAMKLAKSAVMKAPNEVMSRLTWAVCKIMSSLTLSAEPQFGTVPNPISGALVRGTGEAKSSLDEAVADLESLVATTHNPLRNDLEVWRFAALLLHPDRRSEARAYGRSLLRRPNPDPSVVAWALHYRISVRIGSLRKHFIDLLRTGKADPSYVSILALLTAHSKGAEAALAVVNQYAPNFPGAEEFFQGWRANFGVTTTGETFADIMQAALSSQDFKALGAYLADHDMYAGELLAAAELLASKKQWALLDPLRSKLTSLGLERAFALAMLAALNTKSPKAAVEISDLAASSFDSGRLPRNIVVLRIRAQEELGQHAPVIADLRTLLAEKEDTDLRRNLISAYLQIGAYQDVGTELERMLTEPEADGRELLALAHAVRAHSPDLARRAVLLVSQGTETPSPEMASSLLYLASDLGIAEIQSQMLPLVIASADQPSSPVRKFTQQELFDFIDEDRNNSLRKYDQWLQGDTPAVLGLDQITLARLYLSPEDHRRTLTGDKFPMLVRSASRDTAIAPKTTDAPQLCLDLGALLLVERLGLLQSLEAVFSLQVPPSLVETLSQLEAKFQGPDRAVFRAIRAVLGPVSGTLEVVTKLPDEVTRLDFPDTETSGELNNEVLHRLLIESFHGGHLSKEQFDAAIALASIDPAVLPAVANPTKVLLLTSNTIARVARMGVLPAFCVAFDAKISQSDAERTERQMAAIEHDGDLRDRLMSVRELVSNRLKEGAWNTVPSDQIENENSIDHLPPQIRCLMEALSAAGGGSLVWIEDRAISHNAPASLVDIYGILEALIDAAIIDQSRRKTLMRSLREIGYGFAPIQLEAIVSDVLAAPVTDDQVAETADLAAWRIWFAEEAMRLQYIRKDLVQDREGRVAGELRRVLALGALARDVLTDIWQSDEGDRSKQLRSDWVWSSLRAEQYPSLGSEGERSARRLNAVLTIAHVLDIPFHLSLKQSPMAESAGHSFSHWFASSVLDPVDRVDVGFGDEVAGIIAEMLRSVLQADPKLSEDERALSSNLFTKVVNDYLAMLPFKWRTRIADKIPPELGRSRAMVMSLGSLGTVTAAEFCRAFAETITEENVARAEAPLTMNNGKTALLTRTNIGEKLTVEIETAENKFVVDPLTLALSHPDQGCRRNSVQSLPDHDDGYDLISASDWELVIVSENVEERFGLAEKFLSSNMWRTLENLDRRFIDGRPITIEDLDLPEPTSVARFLGVAGDLTDLNQIWDGHEDLIRQVGLDEALIRLSCLPLNVPTAFCERIKASVQGEKNGIEWDQRPFFALLRHAFFLRNGIDAEIDEGLSVNAAQAVNNGGVEVFSALVRRYGRTAAFLPKWQALNPEVRVTLIWSYAMSVLRIFNSPSDELVKTASIIAAHVPDSLMDQIAIASKVSWERELTAELTSIQARALLVSDLCNSGVRLSKGSTSNLIGHEADNGWVPSWDLLFPRAVTPVAFWVGNDPIVSFLNLGWLDQGSEFATRDEQLLIAKILDLADGGEQQFVLSALLSVVDVDRVDGDVLKLMREAIDTADGEVSVEPHRMIMHRLLTARAVVYGKLGIVDEFHRYLAKVAEASFQIWPNIRLSFHPDVEDAGAAFAILEKAAVLHSSKLPGTTEEKFETLALAIEAITLAWPAATKAGISSLDEHARQGAGLGSSAMWSTILRQRMRR